ncbi:hypothetical protein CDAR_76461 [Caerostris darwini]|uniref:Uncharacterized protein n=1 Tax=Caerostris darwini TaxID=1538125 RepID=A0AAV4Q9V1_9ARAC|nr:hypothetical protein CDAR_76461 [Caerostris darwini]
MNERGLAAQRTHSVDGKGRFGREVITPRMCKRGPLCGQGRETSLAPYQNGALIEDKRGAAIHPPPFHLIIISAIVQIMSCRFAFNGNCRPMRGGGVGGRALSAPLLSDPADFWESDSRRDGNI